MKTAELGEKNVGKSWIFLRNECRFCFHGLRALTERIEKNPQFLGSWNKMKNKKVNPSCVSESPPSSRSSVSSPVLSAGGTLDTPPTFLVQLFLFHPTIFRPFKNLLPKTLTSNLQKVLTLLPQHTFQHLLASDR